MPTDPAPEKVAAPLHRAALLLEVVLRLQYERGRLSKVTVEDMAKALELVDRAAGYDVARIEEGPVSEASLGVALLEDPDGAPYPDEVQRAFADRVRGRIEEGERLRAALDELVAAMVASGRWSESDALTDLAPVVAAVEHRAALAASDEAARP